MVRRLGRGERIVLVCVLVGMALIAFWPTHVDRPVTPQLDAVLTFLHHHGMPGWIDYNTIQFGANIILFMPLGALVASMFPRTLWWSSIVLGASASFLIEFVQEEFLHGRTADPGDVLSNAIGAAVGGFVMAAATGTAASRPRSTR